MCVFYKTWVGQQSQVSMLAKKTFLRSSAALLLLAPHMALLLPACYHLPAPTSSALIAS